MKRRNSMKTIPVFNGLGVNKIMSHPRTLTLNAKNALLTDKEYISIVKNRERVNADRLFSPRAVVVFTRVETAEIHFDATREPSPVSNEIEVKNKYKSCCNIM